MAENNRRREQGQPNKENMKSGRQSGEAPRTTETGAQNNGGQTERAADKPKKQKHRWGWFFQPHLNKCLVFNDTSGM